jgi:hypothetical protein
MVLVNMMVDGDTYVYEFNGHLDPKDWQVEVKDNRLFVIGEEKFMSRGGEEMSNTYKWDAKLSRYCASAEFELKPGDYFPGVEVIAPGVYGKQHAGGKLRVVFPLKK